MIKFDKKYFSLAKVKTNVVASGCLCGYIVVYDVEKNICLGKFKTIITPLLLFC